MHCSLVDSLVWVYPDSEIEAHPCSLIKVDVACGAAAAVTILMKAL